MNREASVWTLAIALLSITLTLPAATAAEATFPPTERPDDWTCDETGQLVCAGANAGASVDCSFTSTGTAVCEWTFGQLLGAESPLGLPGEAAFAWDSQVETCLTDGALTPISCTATTGSGSSTCAWLPGQVCVESQGPNPGATDPVTLEVGQCLQVTIDVTATATAWTPTTSEAIATAEHPATGSNTEAVCLQNNR